MTKALFYECFINSQKMIIYSSKVSISSKTRLLKELKKQIQQISEETSYDELFRKVLKYELCPRNGLV